MPDFDPATARARIWKAENRGVDRGWSRDLRAALDVIDAQAQRIAEQAERIAVLERQLRGSAE